MTRLTIAAFTLATATFSLAHAQAPAPQPPATAQQLQQQLQLSPLQMQQLQQLSPNNLAIINPNLLQLLNFDPDPAMNNPDKVSWELFVQVNRPAAAPPGKHNVVFETWAANQDTFKANPRWPGTSSPPTCPPHLAAVAALVPGATLPPVATPLGGVAPLVGPAPPVGATPPAVSSPTVVAAVEASPKILSVPALIELGPRLPGLRPHVVAGGGEEVRRNRPTFDFIFCNNLYTRAGLRNAFAAGTPISFPIESIEVKADWESIAGLDTSQYYVNTASDGQQYALVAMHIISKQVPNWTWATFEHKNNAGRCDYMGCRDRFGATDADVPPKATVGGQYPACQKTAALKKMFTDAGMPALWENYCLKGSQIDFTTSMGLPTLLGNSVIENGFARTSSCLTCHARASVSSNGNLAQGFGFLPSGQSPNGTPDPSWFWSNLGQPNQAMLTFQTDFIWSIPRFAIP